MEPTLSGIETPRLLRARLCDLRPRFLPRCRIGRGYRAIAGKLMPFFDREQP